MEPTGSGTGGGGGGGGNENSGSGGVTYHQSPPPPSTTTTSSSATAAATDTTTTSTESLLGAVVAANNENLNPQFMLPAGMMGGVSGGLGGAGPHSKLDIGDLLAQVMSITSQGLKDAQEKKLELEKNRLRPALYQVLCELKEKTALNMRQTVDDDPQDPQIARLDNMLMAEGVSGPERSGAASADGSTSGGMPLSPGAGAGSSASADSMALEHSDYRQKLSHIRDVCLSNYEIFSLSPKCS